MPLTGWSAVQQETNKLPELVEDTVPLTFPPFVDVSPPEAQIVFDRRDVNAHHVLIVDRIRIRLRHVHSVGHTPAPAKRDQPLGQKLLHLLRR